MRIQTHKYGVEDAFYSIVSNLSSSFGRGSFCLSKLELSDIKSKVMSYLHSFIQATTMSPKDHNTSASHPGCHGPRARLQV